LAWQAFSLFTEISLTVSGSQNRWKAPTLGVLLVLNIHLSHRVLGFRSEHGDILRRITRLC